MFATITNLLDKRYPSFGVFGQNLFAGSNHTFDGLNPASEQLAGPAEPHGM